jgi:hypothetical protein
MPLQHVPDLVLGRAPKRDESGWLVCLRRDAVRNEAVEVHVEVECTAEPLHEGDRAGSRLLRVIRRLRAALEREDRAQRQILAAEHVPALVAAFSPEWRTMFATALFLGVRRDSNRIEPGLRRSLRPDMLRGVLESRDGRQVLLVVLEPLALSPPKGGRNGTIAMNINETLPDKSHAQERPHLWRSISGHHVRGSSEREKTRLHAFKVRLPLRREFIHNKDSLLTDRQPTTNCSSRAPSRGTSSRAVLQTTSSSIPM